MSNTLTLSQAEARIAELEARLASKSKVSFKVSPKGAVAVYGLGRFPVTLYLSQFNALNAAMPAIAAWIKTNPKGEAGQSLAVKGE
jgi:ABC-type Fe3+-hydroxamate transport system substrate-binding protein